MRSNLLPATEATDISADFLAMALSVVPSQELMQDALALAIHYDRTLYDSLYLALMLRENCPFVTADERLFNAVSAALPNVRLLRDFAF